MTYDQYLLLIAHEHANNPQEQEVKQQKEQDKVWEQKLKEAQERKVQRSIRDKDDLVKASQEKLIKIIEDDKKRLKNG